MADAGTILSCETWEKGRRGHLHRCGSMHEEMAHLDTLKRTNTHGQECHGTHRFVRLEEFIELFLSFWGVVDLDMGGRTDPT